MATFIRMPQKGLTEESAILSEWHVKVGDIVKTGDYLFAIETGKATFNIESEADGVVLQTLGNTGEEIAVKAVVCIVGEIGENYELPDAPLAPEVDEVIIEEASKPQEVKNIQQEASASSPEEVRIKISPRAKELARKKGIDIRFAKGTGPKGRIIESDIQVMCETVPGITDRAKGFDAEFEIVPNSRVRKIIAENMYNSLHTMAQLTMNSSFDATVLLTYRERIKEAAGTPGLANITLNDMIIYAVSRTIVNHGELNAHYNYREMKIFKNAHIGVAVDTERGLMVPTIFDANEKSLNDVSVEMKELAEQCQNGSVVPEKLSGASFTVTNLGAFGIESFTPIINPPQTGILGVNTIEYKAKIVDNEVKYYPAITLSLTFDHRALDGAPAARFLKALCCNLENFSLLLAK